MPRGVSEHFTRILRDQARTSLRHALLLLLLVPVVYFMAELVDQPLYGNVVTATLLSVVLGLAIGGLFSQTRTKAYNDSLLHDWNAWQRKASQHARLHDLHRAVHGKGPTPHWKSIVGIVVLLLNGLLFTLLWLEAPTAVPLGWLLAPANALLLGATIGSHLAQGRWSHKTRQAIDELLHEGQITIWGER